MSDMLFLFSSLNMKAKFHVISTYTQIITEINPIHVQAIYHNIFQNRLNDLKQYTSRCEELMINSNNDSEEGVDTIDYSDYEMFALIDVYASWSSVLSDLVSMLDPNYVINNRELRWTTLNQYVFNLFSDYHDPRTI